SLVVFYGWPVSLTLSEVLWNAVLVLFLLLVTILALWRVPKLGFAGAWFFITLAPTSTIVPIATEVGAERRMYLPLIALVALATIVGQVLISHVAARSARRASLAPSVVSGIVLSAVVIVLAARTFARNREYASGLSLAQTVVDRRPTGIAHHILGQELL